jgi:hypothetical protein
MVGRMAWGFFFFLDISTARYVHTRPCHCLRKRSKIWGRVWMVVYTETWTK